MVNFSYFLKIGKKYQVALVFFTILLISITLASAKQIFAADKFSVSYDVIYNVEENNNTQVTQNVRLTNQTRNFYATEYTLSIGSTKIKDVSASDNGGNIAPEVSTKENSTDIKLKFNDKVIGQGRVLNFKLVYIVEDAAIKNGLIWEVNVPKLASTGDIDTYNLKIRIPKNFGDLHYISPEPKGKADSDKTEYLFDKDQLAKSGVVAAFGPYQVFDFELKYHLGNDSLFSTFSDIALPPDTETQQVYFSQIDPLPEKFFTDDDGNYMAKYKVNRGEKLNITVKGSVRIIGNDKYFNAKKWTRSELNQYLKPDKYWESNDPTIVAKAKELKTPEAIYNYVATTLKYGYERVKDPNLERMGALTALNNPDQAICMEYTDLFITLSRAAGIPARELDGFAYTENKKLRPTTIGGKENSDVLHAWPQYYDFEKSRWVSIDPTWGSTTGGIDYFHKLDTNHFVFAIKGISSNQPHPAGSYKIDPSNQGDVKVTFAGKDPNGEPKLEISVKNTEVPAGFSTNVEVDVKNNGPKALQNAKLNITTQALELLNEKSIEIGNVLPYENKIITLKLRTKDLFLNKVDPLYLEVKGTDGRNPISSAVLKPIQIKPFLIYGFFPWLGLFALAVMAFAGLLILYNKLKKSSTSNPTS
ncbi:MAG: transglutaminase family protein [Patescibacteria group bacterium]|nr:transglutaminase family protein [Patescibacteria group bacterium]